MTLLWLVCAAALADEYDPENPWWTFSHSEYPVPRLVTAPWREVLLQVEVVGREPDTLDGVPVVTTRVVTEYFGHVESGFVSVTLPELDDTTLRMLYPGDTLLVAGRATEEPGRELVWPVHPEQDLMKLQPALGSGGTRRIMTMLCPLRYPPPGHCPATNMSDGAVPWWGEIRGSVWFGWLRQQYRSQSLLLAPPNAATLQGTAAPPGWNAIAGPPADLLFENTEAEAFWLVDEVLAVYINTIECSLPPAEGCMASATVNADYASAALGPGDSVWLRLPTEFCPLVASPWPDHIVWVTEHTGDGTYDVLDLVAVGRPRMVVMGRDKTRPRTPVKRWASASWLFPPAYPRVQLEDPQE